MDTAQGPEKAEHVHERNVRKCDVVSQTPIPTQIRQLILCISNDEG